MPSDARAKLVRYSARGRRLMQDVAEVDAELWRELARSFGAAELGRLAATVGALHRELVGPDAPLLLEPRVAKRPRRKALRAQRERAAAATSAAGASMPMRATGWASRRARLVRCSGSSARASSRRPSATRGTAAS
jgi:hypothetical protein